MPIYQNRYVAFVDVLGTSDLLAASAEDETLARKASAIATTVADHVPVWQRWRSQLSGIERESAERLTEIARGYAFSDTIALSAAPNSNGLGVLLDNTITISRKLLLHGFFCRGGIVFGQTYERYDDIAVLTGPAVLDASAMEKKRALNPRVIVTDRVRLDCQRATHPVSAQSFLDEYLVQDADGLWFVDYLPSGKRPWREAQVLKMKNEQAFMSSLRPLFSPTVAKISSLPADVTAKVKWFAAYYERRAMELGLTNPTL